MSDDVEYGMVMPFVVCQSKGGPYDDEAYVAGWEAGYLDGILKFTEFLTSQGFSVGRPDDHSLFHDGNQEQIDLIAMRYGYVVEFTEPTDGWVTATFRRAEEGS